MQRRRITTILLCVTVLSLPTDAQSVDTLAVTKALHFCTNAGPVNLKFDGSRVTGTYTITVVKEPFEGTILGTAKGGLIDAVWTDPDGRGRILFAFTSDSSSFTAIYNNDNNPAHWFDPPWRGLSTSKYETSPPEVRSRYRCQ